MHEWAGVEVKGRGMRNGKKAWEGPAGPQQ